MISLIGVELFYENGVKLGEVLCNEDGYYDFWPELRGGYWSAPVLRQIADLLDAKNQLWDEQVQKDERIWTLKYERL